MSQLPKPTVANYREFKEYPTIVAAASRILARQRFVAPVELFVEMNLLPGADLERWKRGQIPILERVIRCNLTKAGRILRLQTRPCSFRSSSKGHSLQIRTMIEMGVVAQQWEPAFADKCGDPEVIGRDGSAV